MLRQLFIASAVAALAVWLTPLINAADVYLKIEGIPGESQDHAHGGWIDIELFATALLREGRGGAVSGGFDFTKRIDKASPLLMRACATAERIPTVHLDLMRPAPDGRVRLYEMVLEEVQVVRFETALAADSQTAGEESFTLLPEKLSWTYTEFDAAGRPANELILLWDFVRNEGGIAETGVFRVSAVLEQGAVRLSWPAEAGRTYRILSSLQVDGPYSLAETIQAERTEMLSVSLPTTASAHFFIVERQ